MTDQFRLRATRELRNYRFETDFEKVSLFAARINGLIEEDIASVEVSLDLEWLQDFVSEFVGCSKAIDEWASVLPSRFADVWTANLDASVRAKVATLIAEPATSRGMLEQHLVAAFRSLPAAKAYECAESLLRLTELAESYARALHESVSRSCRNLVVQLIPHVQREASSPGCLDPRRWAEAGALLQRIIDEPETLRTGNLSIVSSQPANPGAFKPEQVRVSEEKDGPRLSDIVGQPAVKKEIERIVATARLLQERTARGLPPIPLSFHAVFAGSPGTGKTTIARAYASKLRELGLCRTGQLVEVTRADLVAGYMGQTAIRTRARLEEARGGVLFIDEAYSLKGDEDDSYGQECIETLLKYMEDCREDLVVIAAGYSAQMRNFLAANPGLESRFSNWIEFSDYSDEELAAIFDALCHRHGMTAPQSSREAAIAAVTRNRRSRQFANAREVRRVFERGVQSMGVRLARASDEDARVQLTTFAPADFAGSGESELRDSPPRDAGLPSDALQQLVGLRAAKDTIRALSDWLTVTKLRRGGLSLPDLNLHMVFSGNPGTGKTTVARLVGTLFRDLGLLASGHIVEVDRSGLVAEYSGQTAVRTREACERALGGMLFIDEAYTLARSGAGDSYGLEAVDTLLKAMEDWRGQFIVIVAGYIDQMRQFLASNPGLQSRFSRTVLFEDFSTGELCEVLKRLAARDGFELASDALPRAEGYLESVRVRPGFANARTVRQLFEDAQQRQASRLVRLGLTARPDLLHLLTGEDFSCEVNND